MIFLSWTKHRIPKENGIINVLFKIVDKSIGISLIIGVLVIDKMSNERNIEIKYMLYSFFLLQMI